MNRPSPELELPPTSAARTLPASQAYSIPPAAQSFYRPELDGLRFFAFLAVYANHTVKFGVTGQHHHLPDAVANALGTIGKAGAFGVDLFFVLSSFLITELLLRERRARGSLDVKSFYIRRILRIWPLYFAFLFFAYALTFFVPHEKLTAWHLMGYALFSGNWFYMYRPMASVAGPLWSVSVEEQFYLIWPWAVRRGPTGRIVWLAVGLVVLGMAIRLVLGLKGINEPWVSKNSLTRVDGIAAGVILAAALSGRMPRLSFWERTALLCGGLGVLLWVANQFDLIDTHTPAVYLTLGWPLVAAGCVGVVLSALGGNSPFDFVLRSKPIIYLGRISFGLYVFHQLGLLLSEAIFPRHESVASQWLGNTVLALLLTMMMAAASYRWLERPFLQLKQRRFTVVRSRPE
jgi:peptidoglycan/LPS O-acetylase OafA/YrhL